MFDEDQVEVTLTHSFLISRYETTQAQWLELVPENPSGLMSDGTGDCSDPQCPVGGIGGFDAVSFANLLSQAQSPPLAPCYTLAGCTGTTGFGLDCTSLTVNAPTIYDCEGFRLPTEAEWEYAARAGTTTAYYDGDIQPLLNGADCLDEPALDPIAWYCVNSGPKTHPVGQLAPNAWGLFDMLGNAYEWTNGAFTPDGYSALPHTDPWPMDTSQGVTRGGGYNGPPTVSRSACRLESADWHFRGPGGGFRLVRTVDSTSQGDADASEQ